MACQITLPLWFANLYDVFHVSQLRKYITDPSCVLQMNDVQVRDNMIMEASPIQIEGREVKQFQGKVTALVKVLWGGPT